MKRWKKFVKPVILVAIVALVAGVGLWYYFSPEEVQVYTADKGEVDPVLSMTGNVMGDKKMTIYADVAGVIETRNFEIGERVHAGDLLLTYNGQIQKRDVELANTDVNYSQKILDAAAANRASHQQKYDTAKALDAQLAGEFNQVAENIRSLNVDRYQEDYENKVDTKGYQDKILKLQRKLAEAEDNYAEAELDIKEDELEDLGDEYEDNIADAQDYKDDIYEINSQIIELQRDQLLISMEGMNPEQYELLTKFQNQLEDISKRWTQAKTDMATEESLISAYSEIRSDEQQVARNKIALDYANKELAKAQGGSVSPVDGVITACFVDAGAVVEKGTPIFEMQTDKRYKVRLLVSRFDVASIKMGQSADVVIGKKSYKGKVIRIASAAADDASGKPKAAVDVSIDTKKNLIVGLESDVTIKLGKREDVVRIPVDSVYSDDEGDYTFVLSKGVIERRNIKTGVSDEAFTVVKKGIEAGDRIVTSPNAANLVGEKAKGIEHAAPSKE